MSSIWLLILTCIIYLCTY